MDSLETLVFADLRGSALRTIDERTYRQLAANSCPLTDPADSLKAYQYVEKAVADLREKKAQFDKLFTNVIDVDFPRAHDMLHSMEHISRSIAMVKSFIKSETEKNSARDEETKRFEDYKLQFIAPDTDESEDEGKSMNSQPYMPIEADCMPIEADSKEVDTSELSQEQDPRDDETKKFEDYMLQFIASDTDESEDKGKSMNSQPRIITVEKKESDPSKLSKKKEEDPATGWTFLMSSFIGSTPK